LDLRDFLHRQEDEVYEEPIARNRFVLKHWWTYIEAKREAPTKVRNVLYERAVKCLPGSYKIWHSYLQDRTKQCRGRPITHRRYEKLNNAFERALVTLHKMPRIWLEYCRTLISQKKVTRTRRTFDRALKALPITQHQRMWKMYIKWVREDIHIQETAIRVYRRYLKLRPDQREDYVEYLLGIGHYNEAARQLAVVCGDEKFVSIKGKTKHALWIQLCDIVSKHPHRDMGLDVDAIIRSGIQRFSDEVGRLWCSLADHYIRLAMFEKARDIYEEAIETVMTVRDFSLVFNAYAQFEESMLRAKMEMLDDDEEDEDEDGDVDLRIARLSHLMDRRPLLVNAVKLRQNPHSVSEWALRVDLVRKAHPDDPVKVINCYTDAVKTVDPSKATGKPHTLWVGFAKFYDENDSLENADVIFQRATKQPFRFVDDLAVVWCEWAEMHMRHKEYDRAHEIIQQATQEPRKRRRVAIGEEDDVVDEDEDAITTVRGVQARIHRSKRVWSLYVDLEESLGTLTTTRAAYDRMITIRVATARHILNYADLLKEKRYFEDSFKILEKGVEIFSWPHVKDIWLAYLTAFVSRYEGRKLERARDLFEQVIRGAPVESARPFYILYAQLEEKYGLMRHAMSIYDRATSNLPAESRYDLFLLYLKKAEQHYGIVRTRPIYEKAIESLPDEKVKVMCIRFAELERKLGEIDRARAIYTHGSQFCNPATVLSFWKVWHDFEVKHGNEDTFREMLRVKRSVQAQYSQTNYMTANMLSSAPKVESDAEALARKRADEAGGASAGANSTASVIRGFKRAAPTSSSDTNGPPTSRRRTTTQSESKESAAEGDVEEIAIPDAVFGGLKK